MPFVIILFSLFLIRSIACTNSHLLLQSSNWKLVFVCCVMRIFSRFGQFLLNAFKLSLEFSLSFFHFPLFFVVKCCFNVFAFPPCTFSFYCRVVFALSFLSNHSLFSSLFFHSSLLCSLSLFLCFIADTILVCVFEHREHSFKYTDRHRQTIKIHMTTSF